MATPSSSDPAITAPAALPCAGAASPCDERGLCGAGCGAPQGGVGHRRDAAGTVDLRSRRGISEAVETVFLTPIYYTWIVLVLGFALWLAAMAANSAALAKGAPGHGVGAGAQGEAARRSVVGAALGGYAAPYANAYVQHAGARATVTGVDTTLVSGQWERVVTPFGTLHLPVKQGSVIRNEAFHPRQPPSPGPGLGRWE